MPYTRNRQAVVVEDGKAARYVRAVARARNMSAAASGLGISQPALSSFLKNLEKRLGSPVFDRSAVPLILTDAGRAFLDYADKVEALERDLVRTISDIENLRMGNLVVGGTASFNMALLPAAVGAFVERFPQIRVSMVADTIPNLAQSALEGKVDIFVATSMQNGCEFACEELGQERFFLCVPPSWPVCDDLPRPGKDGFAHLTGNDFRLLDGAPFVIMNDDQQIGERMASLLREYGVNPSNVVRANQALTCLALTCAGVGVSLVTEAALSCCSMGDFPYAYLLDDQSCSRTLYIASARNRSQSRAARAFVEILREAGLPGFRR